MKPAPLPALYESSLEHDSCGVGFLAHLRGGPNHEVVRDGVSALERMEHRGATGADPNVGDGAGILIEIPHDLFSREAEFDRLRGPKGGSLGALPAPGSYAVGVLFRSRNEESATVAKTLLSMIIRQEGLVLIGWRRVPTDSRGIGKAARDVEPLMEHFFVVPGSPEVVQSEPLSVSESAAFERKLYMIRKRFEETMRHSEIDDRKAFYVPSLSSRTLVYKGMLTPAQLRGYFADLEDPRTKSSFAIFHSRFSTNTFPSWALAHPYRMIAHNGEINTLRGNLNFMRAREALLSSSIFGEDIAKVLPVVYEGLSDSACFDSVLELLVMAGRSLPHALMMLIPEAWEKHASMSDELRAFYAYHSCLLEPWDGPACVVATDGRFLAGVLDRNGLRPARYAVTRGGAVGLASEVGVFGFAEEEIIEKGRVGPGRMFLLDMDEKRIVPNEEIKSRIATAQPYGIWTEERVVPIESLPESEASTGLRGEALVRAQHAFGMTDEDLKLVLAPMANRGEEQIASMGNDGALAILSALPRKLYDYFQELFAQVTNPPLDAIREELLTSIGTAIGPEQNLLEPHHDGSRLVAVRSPFIDARDLQRLRSFQWRSPDQPVTVRPGRLAKRPLLPSPRELAVTDLEMLFPAAEGAEGLEPALMSFFAKADVAIENGAKVLILTDRALSKERAPIPALLAVAGLHNHLVRERTRMKVTLIVETGDAFTVHHAAALIGYGATAVHPYLALESLPGLRQLGLVEEGPLEDGPSDQELSSRYLKAISKGVVKVMSKMGISTVASYRGAQIFEAVGLSKKLVDRYFTHTPSRIGGLGIRDLATDVLRLHQRAFGELDKRLPLVREGELEVGGQHQWRRDGEAHLFSPETVWKLQHATRQGKFDLFREYTSRVDEQERARITLRSLIGVGRATGSTLGDSEPVAIEEVESWREIVPRFATGAMSFGAISQEAHETLAIAMNRIGGKSNSGEGGEARERDFPLPSGDDRRSRVKQVASGRFGVTSAYLVSADEIQIKIAQGAKPGEGGQLPGNKVYPWIAEVRHATPGVGLISPPPHHDIYSIEDLAQLIFDLKNANPKARVSVKLVSEVGIGTVAAGVAKAKADSILVSGYDGGTGASPLTSLRHAGVPWELGLAEVQQTLVLNGLRDRVVLQVDGQMKTGRDVVIAALLGAEEYGFATAPLVVMGCVMMRVCHLDTCPVGVATQNPKLRQNFSGKADHVVRFFEFIGEEVRQILARLGARSLDEIIGRVDLLHEVAHASEHKLRAVTLSAILDSNHVAPGTPLKYGRPQAHALAEALDTRLIQLAGPALEEGRPVQADLAISNRDRAVGTMLGSEVTRRFGDKGLPEGAISFTFRGSAGQSFGAFLPRGISLRLEGETNDYVGKGLSGGRLAVVPALSSKLRAEENVIAGNVAFYGATSGSAFIRGKAGERFCVRNSGADVVVEGVGDHGCEYMTGGHSLILGTVGRNFAAGMSGGVAYLLDEAKTQHLLVNRDLVDIEPPDPDDLVTILRFLELHAHYTGSEVASGWLRRSRDVGSVFTKVIPREYRKVIAERRKRFLAESTPEAAE